MIRRGMSRTVVLVGRYVVKVPSLRNGARLFVMGMLANLNEHERWSLSRHPALAQVYLCAPLGLLLVMRRYRHLLDRPLTRAELDRLPVLNVDNNGCNAAANGGRVVLIDYGGVESYLCLEA